MVFARDGRTVGSAVLMQRRLRLFPFEVGMVLFGPKMESGDPADLAFTLSELARIARQKGHLYVGVQPYVGHSDAMAALFSDQGFRPTDKHILYRHTVMIDLKPPEELLFRSFKDSLRSEMRRAEKQGVEIRFNEGPECVDVFYDLYRGSYRRSGGVFQSKNYFRRVWEVLCPKREAIFALARVRNRAAAGALMGLADGNMIYLCGGTSEDKALVWCRPSEGMHWELIRLAKRWGCSAYDLGGANPAPPKGSKSAGISHFKRKFGTVTPLLGFYRYDRRPWLAKAADGVLPRLSYLKQRFRGSGETDYNLM